MVYVMVELEDTNDSGHSLLHSDSVHKGQGQRKGTSFEENVKFTLDALK